MDEPAADGGLPADEWDAAFTDARDDPQPLYPDVESWVGQHLSQLIRRQLGGGLTWCASWWKHPEAISRLEALWRAWETLRLDAPLGMSVWWRDHADHHLAALMSRELGPFAACTPDRHTEDLRDLPCDTAPDRYWGVPQSGAEDRDDIVQADPPDAEPSFVDAIQHQKG